MIDVRTDSMLSAIDLMLQRLDVQTYDEVIWDVANTCLPPSPFVQQSYYQLLRSCLYSGPSMSYKTCLTCYANVIQGLDATDREQLTNMSFVYSQMCLGLPSVSNLETFLILVDCISVSLDKKVILL